MCKTDAFIYCDTCKKDTHQEYLPAFSNLISPYKCRTCNKRKVRKRVKSK